MSIALNGNAKVQVALRSTSRMSALDVLKSHPEIGAQLDEIERQGWAFLYIETVATALAEVSLENTVYRINPEASRPKLDARGQPFENVLELEIGTELPPVIGIPDVKEFRINVCSKSFPRAATVDLATGIVSYLHDPFWKWEQGFESDKKKLSDAREVFEIATWLLDVKKYKLREDLKVERYQELSRIFQEPTVGTVSAAR
jgi:hypothetical protein